MKIALCFLINNKINKEDVWKKWIDQNKDIINVYIHYKNYTTIESEWIKKHCIPFNSTVRTSYYHVVPAYMALLSFSINHDVNNKWFCFLSESCVPIISPEEFRNLFNAHNHQSILQWREAWWNIDFHKRANLALFTKEFQLGHTPWFVLTKKDALNCLLYKQAKKNVYSIICKGGLANESIFAIILKTFDRLDGSGDGGENGENVINAPSTLIDWSRMTSSTSPYVFKYENDIHTTYHNINWILGEKKKNKHAMFLRKVDPSFPDDILEKMIYTK
jgi:hypothetical protein